MSDFIYKIDNNVAKFFHNIYLWGGDVANVIMHGISFIAEAGILFLLIGFGLAIFKRTRKIGGTILLAVALGFLFTNIILKNAIGRARPFANTMSEYYNWWIDAGASFEGGYSFPSGHTTATTAFAVAIFLTTNQKHSWYALLLPVAMASSRIYLMVHYFTDCLGGIVVGIICATIAHIVVRWIYRSRIKFFVWLREFDIIKSKSTTSSQPLNYNTQDNKQEGPVAEFVYTTQAEEKSIKDAETDNNLSNNNSK